jgi:multidrug efflux pump subunit AcrA (membrane-fusion protein)
MSLKANLMARPQLSRFPWVRIAGIAVVVAGCLGAMAFSPVRETVHGWFSGSADGEKAGDAAKKNVALVEVDGKHGLRVNEEAVKGLQVTSMEVKPANESQPLTPQIGRVNYDNDRLFVSRTPFPGTLVEFRRIPDVNGYSPTQYRPIRWGDRVKQDDLLAVVWSQQFGTAKAALVDAISALRLSKGALARYADLMEKGAGNVTSFKAAERQVELDTISYNNALRSLKMWKLPNEEIEKLKKEAQLLSEKRQGRGTDEEVNWARVEIKAPRFCDDPKRELVIIEKNVTQGEVVDPSRDTPLFRLADLSQLQIWMHPPEEYLPLIRKQLDRAGRVTWAIRFDIDPPGTKPLELDIHQISPSLDPNQQRPMLIGYLPNPDNKYLIGQTLTATVYLPPDPDTVEIPTEALNQVEGQNLVFVESKTDKDTYFIRRVAIFKVFQKKAFVRSKLTPEEQQLSKEELSKGRRPLEPLLPGERIVTHSVMELTTALENAMSARQSKARN